VGTNNSAPTLLLNAVPNGVSSPAGFLASNVDDKKAMKGTLNPRPVVSTLVPTLKIGDRLKIDFLYLGTTRWITNVTQVAKPTSSASSSLSASSSSAADQDAMAFTVDGVRPLRIGSAAGTGLRVSKGTLGWTFVIRNVPNPNAGAGKPATLSDPEMARRIQQFAAGEQVCIDYETSDYMFVIKDISPAIVSGTARVVSVGEKNVINGRLGIQNVSCPQAIVSGAKGTEYLLIRPDESAGAGLPAPSANLAQTLKGLAKGQVIRYKYYIQGGLRWLIDAQLDTQTASRN
jgi:hypothetical protein